MKKAIISTLCILLLAGCGNQSKVIKTSKTCQTFANGMDTEVTFEAENNRITNVKAIYKMPSEGFGVNIGEVPKEERQNYADLIGDSIVQSLEQTRDELSFSFDGGLFVITLNAPYNKLSDLVKSNFYLTSDNFQEAIETLEAYDAICE